MAFVFDVAGWFSRSSLLFGVFVSSFYRRDFRSHPSLTEDLIPVT